MRQPRTCPKCLGPAKIKRYTKDGVPVQVCYSDTCKFTVKLDELKQDHGGLIAGHREPPEFRPLKRNPFEAMELAMLARRP